MHNKKIKKISQSDVGLKAIRTYVLNYKCASLMFLNELQLSWTKLTYSAFDLCLFIFNGAGNLMNNIPQY